MKTSLVFTTILISVLTLTPKAFAQTPPIDITSLYEIADKDAIDGDILVYTEQGLVRASVSFTNKIFGILQDKPLLIYRLLDQTGKPVVRAGVADVNITNANGPIHKGDYITSSDKPGKGQKATISGYVLGIALADMAETEGKVKVAIRIEYAELTNTKSVLRLLDAFNVAAFAGVQNPDKASQFVKYFAAGLIVLGSLILSFLVFARSISKSVEAIGRNPLAKTAIQLSIILNAGLTIATILIGVAAAYLILRL